MRDWTKLKVFEMADALVMSVYRTSEQWPKTHVYGLTQQIQRAAVSVSSNLVEGCSRSSLREYCRFVEIAYASSCEVQYQLSIARRLEFAGDIRELENRSIALSKALNGLLSTLLKPTA